MENDLTQIARQSHPEVRDSRPSPAQIDPEYDGQLPHDSYAYRGAWGSYKMYVKGMLGGLFIGGGIGTGAGLFGVAAAAVVSAAIGSTFVVTWPLAAAAVGVGAAWGMYKGAEEFAHIHSIAGTGVMLDEMEVRNDRMQDALHRRDLRIKAAMDGTEDKLLEVFPEAYQPVKSLAKPWVKPTDGPHTAAATMPTTGMFHWKTAAIGLAVGMAAGALLVTGIVALPLLGGIPAVAGIAHGLMGMFGLAHAASFTGAGIGTMYAGVMAMTGFFGASFGIDRSIFRKVFDITDHWFSGQLRSRGHAASLNPMLTQEMVADPSSPPLIVAGSVTPSQPVMSPLQTVESHVNSASTNPTVEAILADRAARNAQQASQPVEAAGNMERMPKRLWQSVTADRKAEASAASMTPVR